MCHKMDDGTYSCILIDFGVSSQSTQGVDGVVVDDYRQVFDILRDENVGFDGHLVKANFGPRELWDHHLQEIEDE